MIRLSGLTPYEDIDIQFTGVRDGEKLFEELEITGENLLKTRNPKIFIGKIAKYSRTQVDEIVTAFKTAVAANDEASIRRAFNQFLPEATINPAARLSVVPPSADNLFAPEARLGHAEK
jgi:FlaA1/EpsC-like NDP-sugar epimerase